MLSSGSQSILREQWLKENSVPAMYGVDTRALTKKLRIHGMVPER
jgi:carbamoylphosphate synthase small subunit